MNFVLQVSQNSGAQLGQRIQWALYISIKGSGRKIILIKAVRQGALECDCPRKKKVIILVNGFVVDFCLFRLYPFFLVIPLDNVL